MEVFDAIVNRRSVRSYKPDPIEETKLQRVLEAVRCAPSAQNRQPYRFIVIRDPEVQAQVRTCYKKDWYLRNRPPVIIVACAVLEESWMKGPRSTDGLRDYGDERFADYWKVDTAIAMQNLMIAATGEGLGTVWIGGFNEACLRRVLRIPSTMRVVAMTPLGYPAPEPADARPRRPKKRLEDLIIHDQCDE
jgi:nitroreductase